MLALVPQATLVAGEDGLTPQSETTTTTRQQPSVTTVIISPLFHQSKERFLSNLPSRHRQSSPDQFTCKTHQVIRHLSTSHPGFRSLNIFSFKTGYYLATMVVDTCAGYRCPLTLSNKQHHTTTLTHLQRHNTKS